MKRIIASFAAASMLLATEEPVAPFGVYKPAERKHWAFQPRKEVAAPSFTAAADKAWVKTPIDGFILAGLKKAGLTPVPRRTVPH